MLEKDSLASTEVETPESKGSLKVTAEVTGSTDDERASTLKKEVTPKNTCQTTTTLSLQSAETQQAGEKMTTSNTWQGL